ncbi:MAG: hemin uptake protein HemP [Hylemonella sp.]
MNTAPPAPVPADQDTAARMPPEVPLDSATLLQGGKAVTIRHNGEVYRLQATRQGKLILTK